MGRGNKTKVITGIILSVFTFISLFLPVWTADTFRINSYYGVDEEVEAFSPILLMTGEGLIDEYSWVAGLATMAVLAMAACAVVNLVIAIKTRDEQTTTAQVVVPGIFIVSGSFVFFIIGCVAVTTYGSKTYAEATYGFPFFVTLGLFITHCLVSRANNKPVGATIVRGSSSQSTYRPTSTTTSMYQQSKAPDGRVYGNLKGAQRILDVYEDKIVLTQVQNLRSVLTQDYFNGTKEIPFVMISSVQFKPASNLILGYIQFEVPGSVSRNNFGSENSWTFDQSMNQLANEVADYCKKQVIAAHKVQTAPVVQQASAADEILKLKQLLDMGAITQEEFDAKKKQLLDL